MRKLLVDFKKKIQESYYYYFYYIGSQKLCEKHLARISRWQEMLDNPNCKRVKRLKGNLKRGGGGFNQDDLDKENNNKTNLNNVSIDSIPLDCKIEIMRRLNTGLDLVNLSKCSKSLNNIVTKELSIWKNLCQFHFNQTNINTFVNKSIKSQLKSSSSSLTTPATSLSESTSGIRGEEALSYSSSQNDNEPAQLQQQQQQQQQPNDLDWKSLYFKLKRRYGHREVYVDMINKCIYCKSLFWKVIINFYFILY
jgi:hypothetical protein